VKVKNQRIRGTETKVGGLLARGYYESRKTQSPNLRTFVIVLMRIRGQRCVTERLNGGGAAETEDKARYASLLRPTLWRLKNGSKVRG
jgi:hypothetical protein